MPVIKQKIMPDSIVYTDSLSSYDKLDVSGFTHHRINHSKEFADCQNYINGIGNFGIRIYTLDQIRTGFDDLFCQKLGGAACGFVR